METKFLTSLDDQPRQGDVFEWDDRLGFVKLPTTVPPVPTTVPPVPAMYLDPSLPPIAFDPGMLAPEQSFDDLVALFPLIRKTQDVLHKGDGAIATADGYSVVERLVINGAKDALERAHKQLMQVHNLLAAQRDAQRLFNHYYGQLRQMHDECPGAFK